MAVSNAPHFVFRPRVAFGPFPEDIRFGLGIVTPALDIKLASSEEPDRDVPSPLMPAPHKTEREKPRFGALQCAFRSSGAGNITAISALYSGDRVFGESGQIIIGERLSMRTSKPLAVLSSVLALGCTVLLSAAPALAYTACNGGGDCWHTDSRVNFPGVKLTFHNDKWADAHKSDAKYHWHEADADHDASHGYWNKGEWHHE